MFQALLLAAGTTLVRAASDDETKGGRYAHFNGMFFMVVFVAAVFLVGKITGALGAPSLVGEILVGVLLGPPVLDFVPNPGVLMLVGEVGLVLLVVEAGLHVDVEMLEIIGARGLAVGLLGSALPLALALTAAYFWGATLVEAFAVAASMATMSTGIALNVMKSGNVLNQPIGQLIIAAATVNEIVNITLITTVENIVRGADAAGYAVPLCVMVAMIAVVGYLAVKKIPGWLEALLRRVPEAARPRAVLACVLAAALVLVPACKYSGSSELLGAFLAGFCFCSDHVVHGVWDRQVKRVMQWLLRLFFSATIGFAIPVRTMGTAGTLAKAGLLLCCGVGKIAMGFFAQPLDADHFGILACAWGEWGEFSFLIAAAARRHHGKGLLRDETYNAICLAVLISMVLAPAGLRFMLKRYESKAKFQIAEAIADTADVGGAKHATYFCLQTKSRARWGQELKLAEAVARLGCEVIDHRQWHPNDHFGLAHCVQELYVRDGTLSRPAPLTRSYSNVPDLICARRLLPTAVDLPREEEADLERRTEVIVATIRHALGDDDQNEVQLRRWLPGCHVVDGAGRLEPIADAADRCRFLATNADGSLRRTGHSESRLSLLVEASPPPPPTLQRSQSSLQLLVAAARHVLDPDAATRAFQTETQSAALHADAHHELDGFVHRGAHHPFALPDDDDHEAEEALVFGTPQYTRPAAPHHLHDVELAPDGGTLLDDSAHIRRRSFSHSDLTRMSPPRPTAAERASSDGAAMRGSKSSGQLTRV